MGVFDVMDAEAINDLLEIDFPVGQDDPGLPEADRLREWASRFVIARTAAVQTVTDGLRMEDRGVIKKAIGRGKAAGIVDLSRMHEIVAILHARAPWMALAATVVMRDMERVTAHGPAPFRTPPMILLGGPGIGKSQWARDLARVFALPVIDVDIGAANGATFALSGTERGWGSAGPGRVVKFMLETHVVNPMVVVDELDKIPSTVGTTGGYRLTGAAEMVQSMIEPTTGRSWTCPFYRLPFDLSRVSWVMTANSVEGVPAPLLDRCQVVSIPDPSAAHLRDAGAAMVAERVLDHDLRAWITAGIEEVIARRRRLGRRTSLRQIERIVARIEGLATAPRLN